MSDTVSISETLRETRFVRDYHIWHQHLILMYVNYNYDVTICMCIVHVKSILVKHDETLHTWKRDVILTSLYVPGCLRKDAPNEKYMQLWCKCELKYGHWATQKKGSHLSSGNDEQFAIENGHRYSWFMLIYLLKMIVFHSKLLKYHRVSENLSIWRPNMPWFLDSCFQFGVDKNTIDKSLRNSKVWDIQINRWTAGHQTLTRLLNSL